MTSSESEADPHKNVSNSNEVALFTHPDVFNKKLQISRKKEQIKSHKCPFDGCGARFSRPWRLEAHRALHEGQKPFVCDVETCDKAYTSNYHLRRHKLTAHSTKKYLTFYKCRHPECKVEFSSKFNEKKHYQRSHVEKTCEACGQRFLKRQQLRRHLLTHSSNLPPFPCTVCEARFAFEYDLSRHLRKHRLHVCPSKGCTETFQMYSSLRKHLSSHPKEYICYYCNKGYRYRNFLKPHIEKHMSNGRIVKNIGRSTPYELKEFTCDICNKIVLGKASLKRHKKLVHEPKPVQSPPRSKPRATRRDKGVHRSSFASYFTQVEISKDIDQQLLKPIEEKEFLKEFLS